MRDLADFTLVGIGCLTLFVGFVMGIVILMLYYGKDGVVSPEEFKIYGRSAFSLIMVSVGTFHWLLFRDYKWCRRERRSRYRD
jgi:hypothetical protein